VLSLGHSLYAWCATCRTDVLSCVLKMLNEPLPPRLHSDIQIMDVILLRYVMQRLQCRFCLLASWTAPTPCPSWSIVSTPIMLPHNSGCNTSQVTKHACHEMSTTTSSLIIRPQVYLCVNFLSVRVYAHLLFLSVHCIPCPCVSSNCMFLLCPVVSPQEGYTKSSALDSPWCAAHNISDLPVDLNT